MGITLHMCFYQIHLRIPFQLASISSPCFPLNFLQQGHNHSNKATLPNSVTPYECPLTVIHYYKWQHIPESWNIKKSSWYPPMSFKFHPYRLAFGVLETGFLCRFGASPVTSSCRPGWAQTQRSTCLCLPSAGIKGVQHHLLASLALIMPEGSTFATGEGSIEHSYLVVNPKSYNNQPGKICPLVQ